MKVWIAYTQYGEDVIGVYDSKEKGMMALNNYCTIKHTDKHIHNKDSRCYLVKTKINHPF